MFRLLIADSKRAQCDRIRNLLDWQHYGFTTIATATSYPEALDVAVDLRMGSPTYGKWFSVELSEENHRQFYIPRGFAHGFSVLSEQAVFTYKCDNLYHPEAEGGLLLSDPDVAIDWQVPEDKRVISERDTKHPLFKDLVSPF